MSKAFIASIILLLYTGNFSDKGSQHLEFIKEQKRSAREYVISLFEKNDIVILCERDHKEFTQYELFLEIVKDPYFINNVGHIFTEVGVSNMNDEINEFLQSEQKDSLSSRNKITSIFREIDYNPYWHCYNFPWFLGELFKINQTLPRYKKLMLHPSDIEFVWSKCRSPKEYKEFDRSISNRDSIMAQNIINRFNLIQSDTSHRKKALVIMNYKHAFLKDYTLFGEVTHNTGSYLLNKYKRVASVYIMGLAIPKRGSYSVVKNGKWDYYFELSKKTDVGFNLENSPFGIEKFDVIPADSTDGNTYMEMFTGLIFYKPIQEHKLIIGWKDFSTNEFIPELRRRIKIYNDAMGIGMTEDEIEESLLKNNFQKTTQYNNIEILRKEIDTWRNGL